MLLTILYSFNTFSCEEFHEEPVLWKQVSFLSVSVCLSVTLDDMNISHDKPWKYLDFGYIWPWPLTSRAQNDGSARPCASRGHSFMLLFKRSGTHRRGDAGRWRRAASCSGQMIAAHWLHCVLNHYIHSHLHRIRHIHAVILQVSRNEVRLLGRVMTVGKSHVLPLSFLTIRRSTSQRPAKNISEVGS